MSSLNQWEMTEKLRLLSTAKAKRNNKILSRSSGGAVAGSLTTADKAKPVKVDEAPKSARHIKTLHDQFTRQNNGIIRCVTVVDG